MFWEKFETLCKSKGLKPQQLRGVLEVSSGTISNWKTKNIIPSKRILDKIADHFKVTVEYLISDENTSPIPNEFPVSEEEKLIITKYRTAGEETRTAVKKILDIPLPSISDDIVATVSHFSPVGTGKK